MRTAQYNRRQSGRAYGKRSGIIAVHAAVCLAVFLALTGFIWYTFGPFESLRASGWPMQAAATPQVTPAKAQITPTPTETPQSTASAQPTAPQPLTYVQVKDISQGNFKGKLMLVSDPSKVKVGLTPFLGDVGAPLRQIIESAGAAGGINGGSFTEDGNGGIPTGLVIADGTMAYQDKEKTTFQIVGLDTNNKLVVADGATLSEITAMNLRAAVSSGPALITDGKAAKITDDSLDSRTAIGQTNDGAVLLLVIDGRVQDSAGTDLKTLQQILLQNGAQTAAALDGGSSTTMDYLGKTLNNPCNISGERDIATAFIVMPGGESNAG